MLLKIKLSNRGFAKNLINDRRQRSFGRLASLKMTENV